MSFTFGIFFGGGGGDSVIRRVFVFFVAADEIGVQFSNMFLLSLAAE